jgi:hypothetical protein
MKRQLTEATTMSKKEPMIDRDSRPTAIDYDVPISDWQMRDLVAVIRSEIEQAQKYTPIPEEIKPETSKPERWKPESIKPEFTKPEKIKPERIKPERLKPELTKAEKEALKPEKEMLKPEKEYTKPEKEFDIPDLVDRVALRVVEVLREQKVIR